MVINVFSLAITHCKNNQHIFWLDKFGDDMFTIIFEDDYKLHKILKETAKFVDAPYIEGCALTNEWIRYEMID